MALLIPVGAATVTAASFLPFVRCKAKMSVGVIVCTYAALILIDNGIAVTAEKISAIVKAANVKVESDWPSLFAKLCGKKDIEDLILNTGSGSVGGGAAVDVTVLTGEAPAPAAPEPTKVEMPKISIARESERGCSCFLGGNTEDQHTSIARNTTGDG